MASLDEQDMKRGPLEHDDSSEEKQPCPSEDPSSETSAASGIPVSNAGDDPNVRANDPTEKESPPKTKVAFYLYVQHSHVHEAYIEFNNTTEPTVLSCSAKSDDGDLWSATVDIENDPKEVSYRYRVVCKGSRPNLPVVRNLFGKEDTMESEAETRRITSEVQYDTFHSEDDFEYETKTLPQSSIFYTKWLFPGINVTTIKTHLTQIERMPFSSPQSLIKQTVDWILSSAVDPSLNDFQRIYLSVILGHLAAANNTYRPLFAPDFTTKRSLDSLLYSFISCSKLILLPPSTSKILKEVAPLLVSASSTPGWLTYAAYFHTYVGVKCVLEQKFSVQKCDDKEYLKLVSYLLSNLHTDNDENIQELNRKLLSKVLRSAPNQEVVCALYNSPEFKSYFTKSRIDTEKVFLEHYRSRFRNVNGRTISPGEKLVDSVKIPSDMRYKLRSDVHTIMLEFLNGDEDPKKDQVKAFLTLIPSLSTEHVENVLTAISRSKSQLIHSLLLRILDDREFNPSWHLIPLQSKVQLCYRWILSKLKSNAENHLNRTADAYTYVSQLMSCNLNIGNRLLAIKVCDEVAQKALQHIEITSTVLAHKRVETFSETIQECYEKHVGNVLKEHPNCAQKVMRALDPSGSSSPCLSRLGQHLVLCAIEGMDTLSPKDSFCEEDELRMLQWIDVWSFLLSATGDTENLRKSRAFRDGKKTWQSLASCVRDGNVSSTFISEINQREKELSSICARAKIQRSAPKSEFEKEKEMFLKSISELLKVEKDCRQKFNLLHSLISFVSNASQNVCIVDDLSALISQTNERNKRWRHEKLSTLKDKGFWGPLLPLLRPAKTLKHLIKSVSFMNVTKICLQENLSRPTQDTLPVTTVEWLVTFLTSEVREKFQAKWNLVFRDPCSLTVETTRILLGRPGGREQLEDELTLVEEYFERYFPQGVKEDVIAGYLEFPVLLEQVQDIVALIETFGLSNAMDSTLSTLATFLRSYEEMKDVSLTTLNNSMLAVGTIVSRFAGEDTADVLRVLGRSKELVSFLKEIIDEDIRFLIDAVEEHSDQFVLESSVSDLIDVHRFLAPLIKCGEQNCDEFCIILKKLCKVYPDIAPKLHQCGKNVNSLRGLYTSVANRGEITKKIIANCLKKGAYSIELQKNGRFEANMSYVRDDSNPDASYSLSELQDFRSRAHLIVSSEKNASKTSPFAYENEEIDYFDFIVQVNLLTEMENLLLKLQYSGYTKYRKFRSRMIGTHALQDTKDKLQQDLEAWENILATAREQYYFLNYYRSDQLCVLQEFLSNRHPGSTDVLPLIHFVDPKIGKEQLDEYQRMLSVNQRNESIDNPHEILPMIGNALKEIFADTSATKRPILDTQDRSPLCDATVKSGEIFVASLEEGSPLTANVMLTLYENTSNAFPEPYQVVFCDPQTTWEEIHLLLQRCFEQSKHLGWGSLFCISNVELLTNEVQFRLVNAVKEKQNRVCEPMSFERNADFRLSLICRGGDHHHVVEEFAQYVHRIAGMSDQALSQRLKSRWPGVKMVTSSLPGLGKTEEIQREMLQKNINIVTFPISGPTNQSRIIHRLKQLNLKKYQCLHLDIGEVNDPLWLDTFLFQLIVTGAVSSGTQFYHLQTAHVFIEIANTLNDRLRESLVISKYFTRVHKRCLDYKDLLVSSEITSDVQVVCQYFDVFDRAVLESTDVTFTGPKKVKPLPARRCRELLGKYYSDDATDITFTTLNTFLGVLANQLLKFSKSAFFKIANLESMLGDGAQGVRTRLFVALLEVSKEFASRSINTCSSQNAYTLSKNESDQVVGKFSTLSGSSAEQMVERVEGMIQWEDSNHLLVVFHGANSQAIAAVYRDKALVPQNIENLMNSQAVRGRKKELDDFKLMSQKQLREKLEKIACTKPPKDPKNIQFSSYALTPDNILKMILIILRLRANVPVIIMGETGCGKTSLVRYLANICQVEFSTFSFHAGVTEDEVIEAIEKMENRAQKSREQIWVFLDEINTCDHLGLINDVMCHHALLGRPLSKNLVFLAACNPYKSRSEEHIKTAGLEGKNITDEYSKLVYRVYPLPEAMMDYVWDYGSLSQNDEKAYISRMVGMLPNKYHGVFVELLAESQKFIRDAEENHFCVSLRDVYRCIILVQWFMNMFEKRAKLKSDKQHHGMTYLSNYRSMAKEYDKMPVVKSIVLALAHCYLSRLPTDELRREYRERMMKLFSRTGTEMRSDKGIDSFSAIVRMEEEDYLARMELPPGTAKNAALRENIFVMLVSIVNRIPVFVVGKPGSSKSLSIQLIRSNLRGQDSRDPLFEMLPQLYMVSYQGSESSTSEGIIKVFEKASKYKEHNKGGNVLPVVLLDEVGLAENSKHNPLKVLHSLLEPHDGKLPDIAVVGISNWALDAAKMNRAIHLSRPDPTMNDLYETGQSLRKLDLKGQEDHNQAIGDSELRCLAKAYFEYQSTQRHANFHGLRDYYSLIKSLSLSGSGDLQQINMALQRNFGGIPGEVTKLQEIFLDKLKEHVLSSGEDIIIPVIRLIQENLEDPVARHLMLITSGDSAIGILKQSLTQLKKEIITIFGSHFEEDQSEDYNYRVLSRIILCMELDCILILRDLERIYGSLYDMLNQNYAVVGKRKNCRVALGAYSNPMCHVNDSFRCIVLTDHHKVDFSDPPFLNRFEKQLLRFSDVLNRKQQEIVEELDRWVLQMSTVQGLESQFKKSDMFVGFHEDTLPSLVLLHSHEANEPDGKIIQKCKDDLMWVATPDGVLRTQKCDHLKEDSEEVKILSDEYFKKPIHDGLASFMETVINDNEGVFLSGDEIGSKTIVMTYSSIHRDISECLGATVTCQIERLSAYKSERQLAQRVDHFWSVSGEQLLILQCKPELDSENMLLARSIIEDKRSSYVEYRQDTGKPEQKKHVCIVVHLQRGKTRTAVPWHFSFLCGWKQVFVEILEAPSVPLNEICNKDIPTILTSQIWSLRRIAENDLLWCFTRIRYPRFKPLDKISHIVKNLFGSEKVYQAVEQLVLRWVNSKCSDELEELWQVKVACDREALVNSSSLSSALEQRVLRLVRLPLAKIIYFLEKENAWPPHIRNVTEENSLDLEYEDVWCNLVTKESFLNISKIPDPLGAESYILDNVSLDLHLPFSQVVIKKINAVKDFLVNSYDSVEESESDAKPNVQLQRIKRCSKVLSNLVPEIQEYPANSCISYMSDLFDLLTADFRETLCRRQRVSIAKCAFLSYLNQSVQVEEALHFCVQLHLFVWISSELILDQVRMVNCTQQFIRPHVLKLLVEEFLTGNQNKLPSFESIDDTDSRNDGDPLQGPEPQLELGGEKYASREEHLQQPEEHVEANESNSNEMMSKVFDFEFQKNQFSSTQDAFPFTGSTLFLLDDHGNVNDESDTSMTEVELRPKPIEAFRKSENESGSGEESQNSEQSEAQVDTNETNSNELISNESVIGDGLTAKKGDQEPTLVMEESEEEHISDNSTGIFQELQPQDDANGINKAEIMSVEHMSDQSNDETDEGNDEQEFFNEILVTKLCGEMLPSQQTVKEQNGGLERWIRNTSLLLSLAFKVSSQIPVFHFLRLCVDFAKTLLTMSTSTKQCLSSLDKLNEIGSDFKPEYLDADGSFQKITEILLKLLKSHAKDEKDGYDVSRKFSALFYGRCLDTNVDTSGARPIVEHVFSLHEVDLVVMMSPIIRRLLLVEERETQGIFVNMVAKQDLIDRCPCLLNIDEVFKDLYFKGLIHHDSYAAVMVCDLIQSLLYNDVGRYSIEELDSSDSKLLQFVRCATAVLSGNRDDNCGMILLSSVAVLRVFFTTLSSFIAKKTKILKSATQYSHVMNEVNTLLTVCDSRHLLQIFFLKQLRQTGMRLFELRKLCQQSEILPAIKGVFKDNTSAPKAQFVSFSKFPEYQEVKVAYSKLSKENEKDMLTFFQQCRNSLNHRRALLGIIANMIYLKRAERKLTDKEQQLVKWVSERCTNLPLPMKEVLLRMVGQKEFDHPQMELSPESSADEVETALLILHISCILASGVQDENSPMYHYFSDPLRCKHTFMLAHDEDRMYRVFEKRKSSNCPPPIACPCGLRIMFKDNQADNSCPNCNTKCVTSNHEKDGSETSNTALDSSKGYLPVLQEKLSLWDCSTAEIHPSVFRALHLIVHACFYAGVAMGISAKEDLSSLLNLKEAQNSEDDPAEFCFNQIKADLTFLTEILCCKTETAIQVMHLVVEKSTELISGMSLHNNCCSTREQRLEWEVKFSDIAKEVLPEALGSARALMQKMRSEEEKEIEDQIHELDTYPSESEQQNQQLKRLFRVTRQPSFEEFRSTFLHSPKALQEKHCFLLLFFAKFNELSKISYLYDLLEWTRLISSALTHRISRREAQRFTINDFICGHLLKQDNKSPEEKERQRTIFKKFRTAWNDMCDVVNQELSQKGDRMPPLTETDPIGHCLSESDSGVYLLTAIKILVSLQNSILNEIIFLSTQGHNPALLFLEKDSNCSGLSSVTLQEAKEKEIIKFSWSDDLFKYAQNNPEYGLGENISYDFERMEIELAKIIAFNKCHLSGSLNKFIFSRELFHSSGPMLTEFRKLFDPEGSILPDDVRKGLARLKDGRIEDARNLLQHIEALIYLLNLKSIPVDAEMTLEKFAQMGMAMLPSPFPVSLLPEPRGAIQLKHVACCYEALEDLLADGAIEALPQKFQEKLPDEAKNRLSCLVDDKEGQIKLQTFQNALRRFVFRYLSSEKFQPEPNTTLSDCLKESSLWSPHEPPNFEDFPKEMTLENIQSVITHLEELDQKRRGTSRELSGMQRQRATQTVVKSQGRQKRRRVVADFSNS